MALGVDTAVPELVSALPHCHWWKEQCGFYFIKHLYGLALLSLQGFQEPCKMGGTPSQ